MAGTTACVALVQRRKLYMFNLGDSRGVLCRNRRAISLSEDHCTSCAKEQARIEATRGAFLEHDGELYRVGGLLSVTRALGDHEPKKNAKLPGLSVHFCRWLLPPKHLS